MSLRPISAPIGCQINSSTRVRVYMSLGLEGASRSARKWLTVLNTLTEQGQSQVFCIEGCRQMRCV